MSEAEIARALDIPQGTMRSWADPNHSSYVGAEFSHVLARAKDLAQAWLEEAFRTGKLGHEAGQMHPSVYKFHMTHRYADYKEQQAGFAARNGEAAPRVQINYIAAPQIEQQHPGPSQRVLEAVLVERDQDAE